MPQYSQENICVGLSKSSFFYRAPLVAAFNKELDFQMKEKNENISFI